MASSFDRLLSEIRTLAMQGRTGEERLSESLARVQRSKGKAQWVRYNNLLIFIRCYASSERIVQLVDTESARFARACKKIFARDSTSKGIPENEGLPFQVVETSFSPECVRWLLQRSDVVCDAAMLSTSPAALSAMLTLSLNPLLRTELPVDATEDEMLGALGIPKRERLRFIVNQLASMPDPVLLEEQLSTNLGVRTRVSMKTKQFSRLFNYVHISPRFYHDEQLKRFDREELISRPLPAQTQLTNHERSALVNCCKSAMVLTARETDPATYMDERSVRYYELERGVSVCLYGIDARHQLPLECYIGYTVLKNGMPCAYGGAWVFGKHANFGINIHEAFRGGESAFILAQLLRLNSQLFALRSIEVEPYQYGLDNPEGISSGAFWFYYRFGFRPVDRALRKLAEREYARMMADASYRSSEGTLKKFCASNMIRMPAKTSVLRVTDLTHRIAQHLRKHFGVDIAAAEQEGIKGLCAWVPSARSLVTKYPHQAREFALWFVSETDQSKQNALSMMELLRLKAEDQYAYQTALRKYLGQ